ncbi:MAG: hypothetical protein U0X91_20825 [Spirosomataceae bacterium]
MSAHDFEIAVLEVYTFADLGVLRGQLSLLIEYSTSAKLKAHGKVRKELETEVEDFRRSWALVSEEIKRRTLIVHRRLQEGD